MNTLIKLLLLAAFVSCEKYEQPVLISDPELEYLYGSWEWFVSINEYYGDTTSPLTEGRTSEVIIEKSTEINAGFYTSINNGQTSRTRDFTITQDEAKYPYVLIFHVNAPIRIYKLSPDTIALGGDYSEATVFYYVRK